ncbi:MAG: hypothetical protein DWQ36_22405 [Acidobacteria bacterium]|nr:MAG: hypothetical protein DWQ30_25705 [Acidobacteriota bacterium]REK00573.1 MAG: hypothetical protein DWQ36_22405 [Acidobacteriota bacterium]
MKTRPARRALRACALRTTLLVLLALLLAAASQTAAQKVRVGEYVHQTFESRHPYLGVETEAGPQLIVEQTIHHPGATYIAPHFAKLDLPPGDRIVVRSPDGQQSWTYRDQGRRGLGVQGGFFATHIKGDTAVVELWSESPAGGYGYKIDYFGRGYSDAEIADFWLQGVGEKMALPEPFFADRSVCTTADWSEAGDVAASANPDLQAAHDTSRAVARLLLNGSAHCTGWLVGDEGHVMTNEHCITSQTQTNDIDFEFMAEGPSGMNCQSALACSGTIEASGGTFITDDAALDYALILPDTSTASGTDLVATYGRLQLRDTLPDLGEPIFHPQHPSGWGKQIVYLSTYPDDPPDGNTPPPGNTVVSNTSDTPCSGGPGDIGYWTDTAGGSSGSPVIAWSDHKVVALHHCRGSAFCTSGNPASDDRNRGVPIPSVITDLGPDLPAGAVCDAPDPATATGAAANGDNRIDVSWTVARGSTISNLERALGTCASNDGFAQIATNATSPHADNGVSGGSTYAYRVRRYDQVEECSSLPSNCVEATATGVCTLPPDFAGVTEVASAGTQGCGMTLSWTEVSDRCGGVGDVVYNVYRSLTPGFDPDATTPIATCVAGSSYVDNQVMPGLDYYYVVRAEDDSGNGGGPCRGGNEDTNTEELSGEAFGPPIVAFEDDVEAGGANFVAEAGPNNGGGTAPFSIVDTDSHSPTHSWFVSDQGSVKDQVVRTASGIALPPEGGALLSFWHHFDTESGFDGGVLEISTNGGSTWVDILDGNPGRFLAGEYVSTLSTGFSNPLPGRAAWNGDSGDFIETVVDLDDFAGQTIHLRWRFGCDSSVSDVGWWVDDFEISTATECTADGIFADGFESGDTTMWSLTTP